MVCPRHLRNRPAARQPASSLRASDLRQRPVGSLVCSNDMQCNESLPRAPRPDLMYLGAALVARIRLHPFASSTKESKIIYIVVVARKTNDICSLKRNDSFCAASAKKMSM